MKVLNSSHISPFGGLNFVHEEFDRLEVGGLLNEALPTLPNQSKYDWRDLMYSFWSIYFCGGDCIEDLAHNLQTSFVQSPFLKPPSPDRVLCRLKELAVPSQEFDTPRGLQLALVYNECKESVIYLWCMWEKYKFHDPQGLHFITCTIVHWIDLFTPKEFRYLIVNSLKHC